LKEKNMATNKVASLAGKKIPALKIRRQAIIRVTISALDRFLNDAFGTTHYDFVNDQEPDPTYEFKVDGKFRGTVQEREEIVQALREGDPQSGSTGALLNYLAARDLVEKGTYLID
jgi:hypothetical protein